MKASFVEGQASVVDRLDAIRRSRVWFIALGVALAALGFLAIGVPFVATLATTLFVGWLLIFAGIAEGIHAIRSRAWRGSAWEGVSAILHIIAGGLLIAFPIAGKLTLTLVLAGFFTAEGILKIVRAVQHRGMDRWGFLLFDGIVTLALGVLIWAHWPASAIWVIGMLVGVHMLIAGMSMLLLAAMARPLTRAPA